MEGLVVRLEANRPTVRLPDGTEWLCHLAGRVRRASGRIRVGDRVEVDPTDPGEGVVSRVAERGFSLERPPVANVGGVVVVFTLSHPVGSLALLDRRLVLAELFGLRLLIVANKADLVAEEGRRALDPWARLYPLVWTSCRSGEGLSALPGRLGAGIHVLTGESGSGKSSLLAALTGQPVRAGALSRSERGRQTTRTVSLYRLGDGYVSDTPGFSRLSLPPMTPEELRWAFPELRKLHCRFRNCLHRDEPGCVVSEEEGSGGVAPLRYRHYRAFLEEIRRR